MSPLFGLVKEPEKGVITYHVLDLQELVAMITVYVAYRMSVWLFQVSTLGARFGI